MLRPSFLGLCDNAMECFQRAPVDPSRPVSLVTNHHQALLSLGQL